MTPLMINICAHDLLNLIISNGVKCFAFADVRRIFNTVPSTNDRAALQNELNVVDQWATQSKLSHFKEKTETVHLVGKNSSFKYNVDGILIEKVEQC